MRATVRRSIDRVQFVRECDTGADLSDLGEYTNAYEPWAIIRRGEYAGTYVADLPCEECGHTEVEHSVILVPCFLGCASHNFYDDTPEDCTLETCADYHCPDLPRHNREYRAFIPYAGGEVPGAHNYRAYGLQDFARMEDYGNGWNYVYCFARAEIALDGQTQVILAGGIGGVESDTSAREFEAIKREALADLRQQLRAIGFSNLAVRRAIGHTTEKDG